jgi:hypothetical protein
MGWFLFGSLIDWALSASRQSPQHTQDMPTVLPPNFDPIDELGVAAHQSIAVRAGLNGVHRLTFHIHQSEWYRVVRRFSLRISAAPSDRSSPTFHEAPETDRG